VNIKIGVDVSTSDPWYDISYGGYLKPGEILEDPRDVMKVLSAVEVLKEFFESCEQQIPGFWE